MADSDEVTPSAFVLRPLSAEAIADVVQLHLAALGYSLNSRLGAEHLARLYGFMQQEPASLVRVAEMEGVPVGVVTAALNPAAMKARLLARLSLRDKFGLGWRIVGRPGIIGEMLRDWGLDRPVVFRGVAVVPCLTAIAVAPRARQMGIGRALVQAVERFVLQNGCGAYHLDTRADNEVARRIYRRLGFLELEKRGRNIVLVKEIAPERYAS